MSIVTVFVQTSENIGGEQRLDKQWDILRVKGRLESIVGIPPATQKLELFRSKDFICGLDDDTRPLGAYPIEDYMILSVTDTNPHRVKNQFTDVSLVDKFELTNEEYVNRPDTVRAFKERNKLGRFSAEAAEQQKQFEHDNKEAAERIKVGDRCEVQLGESTEIQRRGTVRYVGPIVSQSGPWVGIEYDEPLGKNDGSVKGERYFNCPDKYGSFVRPTKVTVGDFPVEDLLDELDELEEM